MPSPLRIAHVVGDSVDLIGASSLICARYIAIPGTIKASSYAAGTDMNPQEVQDSARHQQPLKRHQHCIVVTMNVDIHTQSYYLYVNECMYNKRRTQLMHQRIHGSFSRR